MSRKKEFDHCQRVCETQRTDRQIGRQKQKDICSLKQTNFERERFAKAENKLNKRRDGLEKGRD